MTPEGVVKRDIKRLLADEGIYYFMPPANGYGRAGVPDFVGCVNGYFIAIEAKAKGGKPTVLQEREAQAITHAGGVALVVDDKPGSLDALRQVIHNMKVAK